MQKCGVYCDAHDIFQNYGCVSKFENQYKNHDVFFSNPYFLNFAELISLYENECQNHVR